MPSKLESRHGALSPQGGTPRPSEAEYGEDDAPESGPVAVSRREHGPQRLAEDVIPYKGPAIATPRSRLRHVIVGVAIVALVILAATVILLVQAPLR